MTAEEVFCKRTEQWTWNDISNATEEELVELVQVLCKIRRINAEHHKPRKSTEEIKSNLLEELADVELCLAALKAELTGDELAKIDEWKLRKVERDA